MIIWQSRLLLCSSFVCCFLQDIVIESQGNEEDPTAGLLRGAECNVCMNRPVQVSTTLHCASCFMICLMLAVERMLYCNQSEFTVNP